MSMPRTRVWITGEEADLLRMMLLSYQMNEKSPWDDQRIRIFGQVRKKNEDARERMARP